MLDRIKKTEEGGSREVRGRRKRSRMRKRRRRRNEYRQPKYRKEKKNERNVEGNAIEIERKVEKKNK